MDGKLIHLSHFPLPPPFPYTIFYEVGALCIRLRNRPMPIFRVGLRNKQLQVFQKAISSFSIHTVYYQKMIRCIIEIRIENLFYLGKTAIGSTLSFENFNFCLNIHPISSLTFNGNFPRVCTYTSPSNGRRAINQPSKENIQMSRSNQDKRHNFPRAGPSGVLLLFREDGRRPFLLSRRAARSIKKSVLLRPSHRC